VTAITGVAVDSKGFIYEVGTTSWKDFPTTPGPFNRFMGSRGYTNLTGDVFIRKLAPDNQTVVYSVLIGGSADETSAGIVVDQQGNVYVTGYTDSGDFPVTAPSSHTPQAFDADAFVFELDSSGTKLIYSRLIGGTGQDVARGIALAPDGRVVIAGSTAAADFPATPNAVQGAATASESAFVVRLADGVVDYSTYLGGLGGASGYDVAVDQTGDIYVTGFAGPYFPTLATSFAPQAPFGGFVTKLDHATGQLVYSTYLPGVVEPLAGPAPAKLVIRVDTARHVYVTGPTTGGFPATPGAFQTQLANDAYTRYPLPDAFVLELDESGSHLVFATLFGGAGHDLATGLVIDGGSITIAGVTVSTNLPLRDHGVPACNLASVQYAIGYPNTTFVARFDHSGQLMTSFSYGECFDEIPSTLVLGSSGLLMAGTRVSLHGSFLLDIDMNVTAPVQISTVADAASLQVGAYVPLEIVSIFGRGLGPTTGVSAKVTDGKFPSFLAGTYVSFDGRLAPLLYVSSSQINAVVPRETNNKWVSIAVGSSGTSAPLITCMETATPALFTANGSGTGQGAILNQDSTVNSATNRAARGSAIVLFGTGGGMTNPSYGDGQVVPTAASLAVAGGVLVRIGDKYGKVFYAGAAPGQVNGLIQINVTIPDDAPTGPAVPVTVIMTPYRSQSGVTVAIR